VPTGKKPSQEGEEGDPLSRYLERTSTRGNRLERLERLLRQLNLQAATELDQIEHPPPDKKKN
jgi:hypothetical protein